MKHWHATALLVVIVAAIYYPVLSAPLNILDDLRMANDLTNRQVAIGDFLFHPFGSFFRPVVLLTWLTDKALWGLEARFMHLENLLLHLCNVVLVFKLALWLMPWQKNLQILPAFLAALLFGLHPVNVEAVAWIAGRADLLAGVFSLSTLLLILAWRQRPHSGLLAIGLACFLLACLSKETGLFILPALFYLVLFVRPSETDRVMLSRRQKTIFIGGFLFMVGLYFGWRHQVLHQADYGLQLTAAALGMTTASPPAGSGNASLSVSSLSEMFWYLSAVGGFYLRKLFFPWPLNFGIHQVPMGYAWLGLLMCGASAWALLQRKLYAVAWLVTLGTLSAALLVAASDVSWTPVAERYMYIPCAGFAILVAAGLYRWQQAFTVKPLVIGVLVSTMGTVAWGSWQRTLIWQDNISLYQDTLEKSPQLAMARNQLATAYLLRGEHERAMALYQNVLADEDQIASLSPAMVMTKQGNLEGAHDFLRQRLQTPHTFEIEILHRLIRVLELQIEQTENPADQISFRLEGIDYLNRLHDLTHNPFYLYRIGQYQMFLEHRKAARNSFLRAYRGLPDDSMYKEPSRKLAEAMLE